MVALLKETERVAREGRAGFLILDIPLHENNVRFHSVFPRDAKGGNYELPIVSPNAAFTQRCGDGLIYWTRSQGHFTPFGCRLVGETLASEILTRHLLDSPDAGFSEH